MMGAFGRSLRLRLLVAALLWICVATVIAGQVISGLFASHVNRTAREDLGHHLSELAAHTRIDARGVPAVIRPLSDPRFQQPGSGMTWQITSPAGPSLGSASLQGRFGPAQPSEEGVKLSGIRRIGGVPLHFRIHESKRLLRAEMAAFRHDLALSLAALIALLVSGGALQLWFGLRPLKRLGDGIGGLRAGTIRRLPEDVPSEFLGLVTRLNELLDVQAKLVARGRLEAGNLAHALRTPLALIANEADALRDAGATDSAEFLAGQCDALRRQVDYHMNRAAAAGRTGANDVTMLQPVLTAILSALGKLHAGRAIEVRSDVPPALSVGCDTGDLYEILSNILDNAYKWTDDTILITARSVASDIELEIADNGPGIEPGRTGDVLHAGTRLDSTAPGHGLGLSIASELVALNEGSISLEGAAGGGLVVKLRLPG